MAEYRAHIIGQDGGLLREVMLLCPDDEIAKQYAKQLVDGHDVELWHHDRKIKTFRRNP